MNLKLIIFFFLIVIPVTAFSQKLHLNTVILDNQLKVTWNSIDNCEGYNLYYSTNPFSSVNNIPFFNVGKKTEFEYDLPAGSRYFIAVSAYSKGKNLNLSKIELVEIPVAKKITIKAPILTTSVVNKTVYLQWINSKLATDYRVYYSLYPLQNIKGVKYISVGNNTSFSKVLPLDAQYYIGVVATNGENKSPLSNIEFVKVGENKPKISNPNSKQAPVLSKQTPVLSKQQKRNLVDQKNIQEQVEKVLIADSANILINEQPWINKQKSNNYTIQLLSSTRKDDLISFIKSHQLTGDIAITQRSIKGTIWYSIINGVYPNILLASKAMKKLPESIVSKKPWIRSFKQLKTNK